MLKATDTKSTNSLTSKSDNFWTEDSYRKHIRMSLRSYEVVTALRDQLGQDIEDFLRATNYRPVTNGHFERLKTSEPERYLSLWSSEDNGLWILKWLIHLDTPRYCLVHLRAPKDLAAYCADGRKTPLETERLQDQGRRHL